MDQFTPEQTGFWGAVGAFFLAIQAYFKYKKKKEENMESEQKKDIQDIKEVVEFGFELEKLGKGLFAGGSFHIEALSGVIALYPKAIAAIDGFGDVLPELQDLDAEEAAELAALVVSKGALSEDASQIVQKSLKVAIAGYELFKAIKH